MEIQPASIEAHMDITENALLAELLAAAPQPVDPLTEVTAPMLAKQTGLNEHTWSDRLRKKAEAGELLCRDAIGENGHPVKAYRRK